MLHRKSGIDAPRRATILDTRAGAVRLSLIAVVAAGAAGGGPNREVFCIPPLDLADAEATGKPLDPQLVRLDKGLLEVTMFRMTDPPGPGFRAGRQKIVDARTGAVVDLPIADARAAANLATRPTVSPTGQEPSYTSDAQSGKVTITLTEPVGGRRVLLDATGPGNYTYGLDSVFWSPDFEWIAADDGRILVITTEDLLRTSG